MQNSMLKGQGICRLQGPNFIPYLFNIMFLHAGMARRMLQVTEEGNIAALHFLDTRVCPQEGVAYPPYDTRTDCYLLVWCRNSKVRHFLK